MKKIMQSINSGILILFAAGMILILFSFSGFITSFLPPVTFEDLLEGKEIKIGSHIEGNVVYALDYFATDTTYEKNSDGIIVPKKNSGNYYIIPFSGGYLGLKTDQTQNSSFDRLTEETYAFLKGGQKPQLKIFIDGEIIPMKKKLLPYFHKYLSEAGYSEEEIKGMGTPFLIRPRAFIVNRIVFSAGILFLFLSAVIFRRIYRRFCILEEFSKDIPVE
ncbi:DUF6709 family protein [Lacrimispora sp. 38-1]|uniref:DUF6709 family protein n=1 Tax=Lacrimispora sp. 38-1 TaxID=3125778 RepID=UPI003CF9E1F1